MSHNLSKTLPTVDRRKKRTSTNQYLMYLEMMEKDRVFASGRTPRDGDINYLQKKWKELSDQLNTCSGGPTLTAEEWRKRLNDWKNTTRCKYRRSMTGEKDIALTSLELKALKLFGKSPTCAPAETLSIKLKSEMKDYDEMEEMEHPHTSEAFQKELQAAVEEAIGGEDEEEDHLVEESEEHEEVVMSNPLSSNVQTSGSSGTTYRTIVQYTEDDQMEFISQRRPQGQLSTNTASVQTTSTGTSINAKLINGEIPMKRLRSQTQEHVIYEVKNAPMSHNTRNPRTITIHNSGGSMNSVHHVEQHHGETSTPYNYPTELNLNDTRELTRQLKRIADIKSEKLRFQIASFKFNNPGFDFHPLL